MPLTLGTRIGPYETLSLLGSGGMGEVYRARDTKLGRDVALKILPDAFISDPERLARFQREAQVLASLNHPHIGAIYGLEESNGVRALVLELVEGPTLADRFAQGAIPLDEALSIAKQIAEALEAAHEQGVIHRDLKPANIKVRPDGTVKVLDFGLAKLTETPAASGAVGLSQSPTITTPEMMTRVGTILGTAAYMSPEQATGRPADKRSDVWAFGCVLYEMLAGRRAFEGEDVAAILGAVLKTEPDWTRLRADTPPPVRRLLRLCLEKHAKNRRSDASDVRIDIEQAVQEPERTAAPTAASTRRTRVAWIVAAVMSAALASIAVRQFREAPLADQPEMRLEITTPATSAPLDFALSPDGRNLVFVASGDGAQRLWLRRLDQAEAQPLAGTDEAIFPFWSADNRSIGFFSSGKLKRIDVAGGPPRVLTDAAPGRGGAWNADGTILFASSAAGSRVFRIPASGGEAVPVTRLAPSQTSHRFPRFLADGRHFIFYAQGTTGMQGIYLASLDGGEPKRLTAADTAGEVLGPDRIVFISQGALVTRRLDLKRGELLGGPETLADHVGSNASFRGGVSVSGDGRIAYRASGGERTQLTWHDRTGKPVGVANQPDGQGLLAPELSPDGRRVAVDRTVQGNRDVWLIDPARGGLTRLTFGPSVDGFPVWAPDGTRIAFESNRKGPYGLYIRPSGPVGTEEAIAESPNSRWPLDWSKDGRFLLYHEDDPKTGSDIWALPMTGSDRTPIVVARSATVTGQFSPDGRWVAYDTNESGQFQIVVQPFPNPSGKSQISTGGGTTPRWRVDGKELYFIGPDGKLMASLIHASASSFEAETPVPLFQTRMNNISSKRQYAVASDGRFLINQILDDASGTPITLILNWKPGR
jgi:serine/threonine protein kinase/Tol biopolymer transport system component